MKKLVSLLIVFGMMFSVVGCEKKQNEQQSKETVGIFSQETMTIKESVFSAETMSVLEIVDDEILFFDFTVDDNIKSYSINAYIYVENEWVDYGTTSGNVEHLDNRMGIKVDETGYDIHMMDDSGFTGYQADSPYNEFENTTQQGSYKITSSVDIISDEEITLWSKIGNNENGLAISPDFRNADCTAGMTFTVVFSNQVLQ